MGAKSCRARLEATNAASSLVVLFVAFVGIPAGMAQTLTGIKVEPAVARVGEQVRITASFDLENDVINCGMRIHFGDGRFVDYRINQKKDVPLVAPWTYLAPGDIQVMAEPKTVGLLGRCFGKMQVARIRIDGGAAANLRPLGERVAEAKELSSRMSAEQRDSARELFSTAFKHLQSGNFGAAKAAFEKGLAIDPANAAARYYMAEALVNLNDRGSARPHYEMAAALAPGSSEGQKARAAVGGN